MHNGAPFVGQTWAVALVLSAATSYAAVAVTDQGTTIPTGFVTGHVNTTAPDAAPLNSRFGWDDGEEFGQTFTTFGLVTTLDSIFIAYNGFDDSGATGDFTITVDAGNDGSNEITESVTLASANFSGDSATDSDTGPTYWMKWDLSSNGLDLPAGLHSFNIKLDSSTNAVSWLLAPQNQISGDGYPDGAATGILGSAGRDAGFAVTGASSGSGPSLTIDRTSGALSLATDVDTDILGYSIKSASGTLNQSGWTTIATHYDAPSNGGDGSIDTDDHWNTLTAAGANTDLSEAQLSGPGPFDGGTLRLADSPYSLGTSAWNQFYVEDVRMELLLNDSEGTIFNVPVTFTGNDDAPFQKGDLNFDGGIDADDVTIYMSGQHTDLSPLSIVEAYALGDMNADLTNDHTDLIEFRSLYDAAQGAGAFDAAVAAIVPEPSTLALLAVGGLLWIGRKRRSHKSAILSCLVMIGMVLGTGPNSNAAVTVTDHPEGTGSNPYLPSTDASNYVIGYETIDQRFGLDGDVNGDGDPVEAMTQSFTLESAVNLESVFVSYNDYRAGGVIRVELDYGNDGGVDFTQDVVISGLTAGTGTNARIEPQNWLELDFSAEGLTLPEGVSSYTIGGVSEEAGSSSFMFAPQYEINPSGYADGAMSLNFSSTAGDAAFGISGAVVVPPQLTLEVNTLSGATKLVNPTGSDFTIDYYEIRSPSGMLDATGWNSLDEQNIGGDGVLAGWTEAGGSDANLLSETNFLHGITLADQEEVALGNALDTGVAGEPDLEFWYDPGDTFGSLKQGLVAYDDTPPGDLVGDFNNNGQVEQGDLDLVLLNWGDSSIPPGWDNDPPTLPVGSDDLARVRQHWGNTAAVASAQAVPEPSSLALLGVAIVGLLLGRRRGR